MLGQRGVTRVSRSERLRLTTYLLSALCVLCAGHAVYSLIPGLVSPILTGNGSRESQTALSAYWLWRGGPWLAYETPVLGFPWAIPHEFPVYQLLVAALLSLGIPIHIGGRILSFVFFIGCLGPLWLLFKSIKLPAVAFLAVSALFLASPMYLFWGRAVLIETCAVFFGLLWLAFVASYLERPADWSFMAALLAGSLGVLAKSTTFMGFAGLAVLLIIHHVELARRVRNLGTRFRPLALAAAAIAVPFLVGFAWVAYSDAVKLDNPIGSLMVSSKMLDHVFGPLNQRFDPILMYDFHKRVMLNNFGYAAILAIQLTALGLASGTYRFPIMASAAAFVSVPLVFTNLHIVHLYYQTANAIFVLAAAGFAVAALIESGWRVTGVVVLIATLSGQLGYFHRYYAAPTAMESGYFGLYRAALMAREMTRPDESLIVLGNDWSSEIPYHSERRALAVPQWVNSELRRQIFADPQLFLGPAKLGAVVSCSIPQEDELERRFISGRAVLGTIGGCKILSPLAQ